MIPLECKPKNSSSEWRFLLTHNQSCYAGHLLGLIYHISINFCCFNLTSSFSWYFQSHNLQHFILNHLGGDKSFTFRFNSLCLEEVIFTTKVAHFYCILTKYFLLNINFTSFYHAYLTNVWEFVKKHKISCSKIYFKMCSTLSKIIQIKLSLRWRDFRFFELRNGTFDSLSNSCSSEAILNNFGLFTEIFIYINN